MPKSVSGDVGGVVASIRVPVGSDTFDIPRDTETMANDILAAIKVKSSLRTWRQHTDPSGHWTLEYNPDNGDQGYHSISEPVVTPVWNADAFVFLRLLITIDATHITHNAEEGPKGCVVRVRFVRWHGGHLTHSGYQDFLVPGNGTYKFSHTIPWDNTGGSDNAHACIFWVQAERTPFWTCNITTRQFDAFMIERSRDDASAHSASASLTLDEPSSPMGFPREYRKVVGGIVQAHTTDLAWLNRISAALPDEMRPSPPSTVASAAAIAAGMPSIPAAAPVPIGTITLGDDTKAVWNGTTWTVAP